mmetsp:Transcript_37886/g.61710  ORF Transcript_37886/g.61710 Transcript_37886/m.61710 type:complete len:447 (-) Transcript_37886:153-1493(-)
MHQDAMVKIEILIAVVGLVVFVCFQLDQRRVVPCFVVNQCLVLRSAAHRLGLSVDELMGGPRRYRADLPGCLRDQNNVVPIADEVAPGIQHHFVVVHFAAETDQDALRVVEMHLLAHVREAVADEAVGGRHFEDAVASPVSILLQPHLRRVQVAVESGVAGEQVGDQRVQAQGVAGGCKHLHLELRDADNRRGTHVTEHGNGSGRQCLHINWYCGIDLTQRQSGEDVMGVHLLDVLVQGALVRQHKDGAGLSDQGTAQIAHIRGGAVQVLRALGCQRPFQQQLHVLVWVGLAKDTHCALRQTVMPVEELLKKRLQRNVVEEPCDHNVLFGRGPVAPSEARPDGEFLDHDVNAHRDQDDGNENEKADSHAAPNRLRAQIPISNCCDRYNHKIDALIKRWDDILLDDVEDATSNHHQGDHSVYQQRQLPPNRTGWCHVQHTVSPHDSE